MTAPGTRAPTSPNGFTLLEILLALSILATVLSTVFASYTGAFRLVSETESQAEIYQMARVALERILEDLESFYPEDIEDEETPVSGGNETSLRFLSRAHVVFGQEDQSWGTTEISYEVGEGDGEEDRGNILSRRQTLQGEPEDPSGGGADGLPVCERLASVSFRYYYGDEQWRDDWDPSSEEELKMVSVTLEFLNPSDPETPLKFATGVYLRAVRVDDGDVNAGD
jgi:general secretion pathway protein J